MTRPRPVEHRRARNARSGIAALSAAVAVGGLVTLLSAAPPVVVPSGGTGAEPPAQAPPASDPPKADAPKTEDPPAADPAAGATTDPPPATATPPASGPESGAPPSLDDLLGIGGASAGESAGDGNGAATAAADVDPEAAALDRALAGASPDQLAELVLESMRIAARRLDGRRTDLVTQRTQEDVLKRLEMLMDMAEQQQSQQSSSSSSSSSSQGQPQGQPGNPGEQQSSSQSSPSSQSQQSQGDAPAEGESATGAFTGNPATAELEETRAEWGALPERVRQMLLQGTRERFSSLYDRLTREYYQRLAEEGSTP